MAVRRDNQSNLPGRDGAARQDFVRRICDARSQGVIEPLLQDHRGLVRKILDNPYLAEVFWRNPSHPKAKGWGRRTATTSLRS